jgi:hypothetical protein
VTNRIRGLFANARGLSYFVVRIAVAMLGNGPARRFLESPSWGETQSPPGGPILDVDCEELQLPGCPFDALPTSEGDCVFVSLQQAGGTQRTPGSIAVLHREGKALRLDRQIALPAAPWGLALVHDESLLAVANSHGVALIAVDAAGEPARDAIVGIAHYGRDLQTIRVLESLDGKWLFASDEHNRTISVLDLSRDLDGRFSADALVSQIPVDLSPLGMDLSADGKYLYVTCEMSRVAAPDLVNWFVWGATLQGHLRRAGVLTVIDLAVALEDPRNAVVAKPPAGGHPVRIQHSRERSVAWITARASNQLIAFATKQAESPQRIAATAVGPAPVGLSVLDELGVVLVANSNRFASSGGRETLSVIDCERALAGQPASLGRIQVGSFPREITVDRRYGIVYVTNFDSQSLSMISIESIQRAIVSLRASGAGERR